MEEAAVERLDAVLEGMADDSRDGPTDCLSRRSDVKRCELRDVRTEGATEGAGEGGADCEAEEAEARLDASHGHCADEIFSGGDCCRSCGR